MNHWTTIADLATGAGTLVLAVATFASVRSANRTAKIAEVSRKAGMRPVMMNSRLQDATQKVGFGDGQWVAIPGGCAAVETTDSVVYCAVSIRNAGTGMGIMHGWRLEVGAAVPDAHPPRPDLAHFTAQTRDMYVAPADVGFWQGALRDPATRQFAEVSAAIKAEDYLMLDLLYGDFEGGQRVISRFRLQRRDFGQQHGAPGQGDGVRWIAAVVRHWNVDQPDPR